MKKNPLFSLPYPSTSAIAGPSYIEHEKGLAVSLKFDEDGLDKFATILFVKPRAMRQRDEIYCTPWHVDQTYDTVCEVEMSQWVEELRGDAVEEWRNYWVLRHFIVYIDSFGCLEVVSEDVMLIDG
jgi:hypothetical protein